MARLLPSLLLLLVGLPASAEIYRWTDAEGRLHFTESLDRVPADQRAKARAGAAATPSRRLQRVPSETRTEFAHTRREPLSGTLRIPFQREGSLMRVDVRLNDRGTFPFYVDTGASGISLPRSFADQLGIRTDGDTRHVYVRTANGLVSRPIVTLDAVQLGRARVERVDATVNPTMEVGLLGGSFFNNFIYRVDAAQGVITLEPNDAIRGGLGEDQWRRRFQAVREPLQRLELYLESNEIKRASRRQELEERRGELRNSLEELELEANRLGVPASWRE